MRALHPLRGCRLGLPAPRRERQGGQILVIFVLAIIAIVGMVGLVIDGGAAYAQKRDQQNVSDLAALAGATAYLNTSGTTTAKTAAADAAARAIATANGITHDPANGVTVIVTVSSATSAGATVKVDIGRPHQNYFAGVLGQPTWGVAVTATAQTSDEPNGAYGAMPLLFNEDAFDDDDAWCDEEAPGPPCDDQVYNEPPVGSEDVPQDATQFNWTIFCTANGNPCNANSDGVRDLINGEGNDTVVHLGMDIGPLNAGSHTTLFDALEQWIGYVFPVPIVDDEGVMVGFAYFRLTDVQGQSNKVVRGYFVSPVNVAELVVVNGVNGPTLDTGVYVIKLID
jgi:Flp pilus assembly protein TadG